jgi:hypothetical protein
LDETKARLIKSNHGGNCYVRCTKDERLHKENIGGKVKYGGGGISYWAAINAYGVSELIEIEGTLTGEKYEAIVRGALKNFV